MWMVFLAREAGWPVAHAGLDRTGPSLPVPPTYSSNTLAPPYQNYPFLTGEGSTDSSFSFPHDDDDEVTASDVRKLKGLP